MILTAMFSLLGGIATLNSFNHKVEAAAAVPTIARTTKRVWFNPYDVGWWASTDADVRVHYFNNAEGVSTSWPGVVMNKDVNNNNYYYYDIDISSNGLVFARTDHGGGKIWNQTTDVSVPNNYSEHESSYYGLLDSKNHEGKQNWKQLEYFSVNTTKVVQDFKVKTDGLVGNCEPTKVQSILNDYTALSDFEREQFNNLDVGDGVTGLQRLQYLNIAAGIDNNTGSSRNVNKSLLNSNAIVPVVLISVVGLSALLGYHFITKKSYK